MVNSYKYVDIIVAILSPETPKPLRLQGFSKKSSTRLSGYIGVAIRLPHGRNKYIWFYSMNTMNVTNMASMFNCYGSSSTVLSVVTDVSSWDTTNVTAVERIFYGYGKSSISLSTVPNVNGWNTASVTNMSYTFGNYGYSSNALNFTLDLSDWRVASVTNYTNMFNDAGLSTSSWTVTIPAKTGNRDNSSNAWYVGNGTDITKYIEPASGKQFTPADD